MVNALYELLDAAHKAVEEAFDGGMRHLVTWGSAEYWGLVNERESGLVETIAGLRASHSIEVLFRRQLFADTIPTVGNILGYKSHKYRIQNVRNSPDGSLIAYECESANSNRS